MQRLIPEPGGVKIHVKRPLVQQQSQPVRLQHRIIIRLGHNAQRTDYKRPKRRLRHHAKEYELGPHIVQPARVARVRGPRMIAIIIEAPQGNGRWLIIEFKLEVLQTAFVDNVCTQNVFFQFISILIQDSRAITMYYLLKKVTQK